MAEIGVFKGEFSQQILDICHPSLLYLVDLFSGRTSSGDKDGNNIQEADMDVEYEMISRRYEKNPHVNLIKSSSHFFLEASPSESIEIVYIDADHSYESVSRELALCRDRVTDGGYICGHDYVNQWGVKRAVDEFCESEGLEIEYLTEDIYPSYCIINRKKPCHTQSRSMFTASAIMSPA
jgi:hypothetical protein